MRVGTHLLRLQLGTHVVQRDLAQRHLVLRYQVLMSVWRTRSTHNLAQCHDVLATDQEHANVNVGILELAV